MKHNNPWDDPGKNHSHSALAGSIPASQPQPDQPFPQSQSFSRSYRSRLCTSLTYIVLLPEAIYLGDLHIYVRSGMKSHHLPPGWQECTRQCKSCAALGAEGPISERIDSRAAAPLQRNDNSSGSPRRHHLVHSRRHAGTPGRFHLLARFGNINPNPFR